jgi:hypothetical protein
LFTFEGSGEAILADRPLLVTLIRIISLGKIGRGNPGW